MGAKISESLKDFEEFDLEKPSIEELCKNIDPILWRFFTLLMWVVFLIFIAISVFHNFKNSQAAKLILDKNHEIPARVTDVIQILKDGKYTDYSVDLELDKENTTYVFNLDMPKDEFERKYKNSKTIPIIFDGEEDFNLKSYYVTRSNMFSNWFGIMTGYIFVFGILYAIRHFCIKFTYNGAR